MKQAAVFNDEEFEVTTFRKDLEYFDNRHPYGVLFSKRLKKMLQEEILPLTECI